MLPRTDTQTIRGDTAEPAEGSAKEDSQCTVDGFQCWPLNFICAGDILSVYYIYCMMAGNHLVMYINLNCECS